MEVHHPESGRAIVHPPMGMNGAASPELAAVALA